MKWYQKTWVIILLLIFIWPVGLILMWTQGKFNKIARIIITLLFIIIAIAGCGSKGDTGKTSSSEGSTISSSSSEATTQEDKEKETENKKIKDMENKYEPILISQKDYATMTNEEGNLANEMISNWDKLSDEFRNKYNDSKNAIATSITNYNNKKKEEEAAQKAAEEAVAYDTGITYEQLARTPDDYKDKKVKFTGRVVQVMEGDKETDLRIAVGDNYDTILFVGYNPNITSTRILENDYVTIKGKSVGIYTYQSTMGGQISIPGVWVDNIVIN
ncbi:hypothetical protein [uncultured Clostridium sp.]|uniref:hypothetical protein n=1 Tax=uncultured Clostridium sp. TaxID=59620 RepID=UPI0025FB603B|nr:hypothetical protein [uncultured Clostridium sp.]